MKLILETNNPKKFISYDRLAIDKLLSQTKDSVLEIESVDDSMIVAYRHQDRIYRLHMSRAFKYGVYDAEQLANALNSGIASNDTFQLEKITSHDVPRDESGFPDILGEDLIM